MKSFKLLLKCDLLHLCFDLDLPECLDFRAITVSNEKQRRRRQRRQQ